MDDQVKAECGRKYPPYDRLNEMEAKQDCLFQNTDITEVEKYIDPPVYGIHYTIGENNQFVGRNRVFEFEAHPLDVLELHFRLSGAQKTIRRNPQNPSDTITGKFSVFEAVDQKLPAPMGLTAGRHLLPRSPSQILPGGEYNLSCPSPPIPANQNSGLSPPAEWMRTGVQRLPTSCRPWTRLGWTEVLLGAQYRTYSDAQKIRPGLESNTYSIKRRREILRLQPEIEVEADKYVLEYDGRELPIVELNKDVAPFQHEIFNRHDPNVVKVGGDWVLFASKEKQQDGGSLVLPPAFEVTPFVVQAPTRREYSLRYDPPSTPDVRRDAAESRYDRVSGACATTDNYSGCDAEAGEIGDNALSLKNVEVLAFTHRFVGPVTLEAAERAPAGNRWDRTGDRCVRGRSTKRGCELLEGR